jgi:hypothetical protein
MGRTHTPFARRQSGLGHFRQALTSGRAKREPGSGDCEGLGVSSGLSGREPARERHEGAYRGGLWTRPVWIVATGFALSRDDRVFIVTLAKKVCKFDFFLYSTPHDGASWRKGV